MNDYKNLVKAILRLRQSPNFTIENDEINWLDEEQTKPSEKEIEDMIEVIKKEEIENDYKIKRKEEYDKLNQFELLYNDMTTGSTTFIDTITAIKEKYPKPNKK